MAAAAVEAALGAIEAEEGDPVAVGVEEAAMDVVAVVAAEFALAETDALARGLTGLEGAATSF